MKAELKKINQYVSKEFTDMDKQRAVLVLREFNGLIHGGDMSKIHEASINIGIKELGEALDMAIDHLRKRK